MQIWLLCYLFLWGLLWSLLFSPPPPATCGCGNDLLSGEICLNTTYYVYSNNCSYYYHFSFEYVIFIPTDGEPSLDDALLAFMIWIYGLGGSGWTLTTDSSDVSTFANFECESFSGNAQNCYMWESDIYASPQSMPFTSYDIIGCTSSYPSVVSACDFGC